MPNRSAVILAETKRPSRRPPYHRSDRMAWAQGCAMKDLDSHMYARERQVLREKLRSS